MPTDDNLETIIDQMTPILAQGIQDGLFVAYRVNEYKTVGMLKDVVGDCVYDSREGK